ncbi:transcription initiation factor TFIID subunit 7-like [Myotis myotis]|uniref:transcription initiation factor TFIID subunit 7-like n=1 Tax=Myotis myotis TaxID=51298 RepID=UPI0017489E2B|nr:transcription initiation factor TFIID subunit 7-like [Myotis myotis]
MEYPDGQFSQLSECNSKLQTLISETISFQEPQIVVDSGTKTASGCRTQIAGEQGTSTLVDHGARTDAYVSAQGDAQTLGVLIQKPEMSKHQHEAPYEIENQFIWRLPPEHAATVREIIQSGSVAMKDKLKIDLSSDGRHAAVEVKDVSLTAKVVDLPCVIGSLKTLDNKMFYKTADISQMLVCTADGDLHSSPEEAVTSTDLKVIKKKEKERQKKYAWKHGITPPLKNVRKKRFRKTRRKLVDFKQVKEVSFTECTDSPDPEKEVKRLLRSDAEAVSVRWEVIAEGETKEIESKGSVPSFEMSPGTSGYKRGDSSPEYHMLRRILNDSSNSSDDEEEKNKYQDEDEDEDEEEEEEEEEDDDDDDDDDEEFYYDDENEEAEQYYEENMERELQAKLIEFGQCKTKEGISLIVVEIRKHIHYMEKKIQEIQCRAQRQKNLIKKVENLTLKNHLYSVLEQLELQKKQKNEQIISLQEKLKFFLEK